MAAEEAPQTRPDLRIDITREDEVRRWCDKFGVTADELKQVVAQVGDRIRAVGEELGRRALFGMDRPPARRNRDRPT
jgi:hypothetical protein